jgi:hypothetical protein
MSASATQLEQPVVDGGIASVNFFNGRLLTGEDLSREQLAARERRRRFGRALGSGVAYGLELSEALGVSGKNRPVLRVEPGLAVNAEGTALELVDRTDVLLVRDAETNGAPPTELFADCQEPGASGYTAGFGVYVLTIGPAESGQGRAPTSGLGNVDAACDTNVFVEGVRFRLVRVNVRSADVATHELLRSHVAARAFGVSVPAHDAFARNPFGPPPVRYGLVDELGASCLTTAEVPLAVLAWTAAAGIEFVDLWAVRRRLVAPAADRRWPLLVSDRAAAEREAMLLQFQAHALDLAATIGSPEDMAARDRFEYLPPVGLLPILGGSNDRGFNAGVFFGDQASTRAELIDAGVVRALMAEGALHDPIEVGGSEAIQLYLVWENVRAIRAGDVSQLALVFAKHTIPYRGIARFGDATWEISRFAPTVI